MNSIKLAEHIRKRPAMYIGDLALQGFKNMLGYFFDEINSSAGQIPITVEFKKDNVVCIEVSQIDTQTIIELLQEIDKEVPVKLLALPVIAALAEQIHITVQNPPSLVVLWGNKGSYQMAASTSQEKDQKLLIEFKIDFDIFNKFDLDYDILNDFIRKYAYLNSNFKIKCIDSRHDEIRINIYYYPNGISHLLDYKIGKQLYCNTSFRFDRKVKIDNYSFEISFAYLNVWLKHTDITSYAHNTELIFGGSLVEGILDGILTALKEVAAWQNKKVVINRKKIKEQLILIATVKGDEYDFVFKGSLKGELDMPKMKKQIKDYIHLELINYFKCNESIATMMLGKYTIEDFEED